MMSEYGAVLESVADLLDPPVRDTLQMRSAKLLLLSASLEDIQLAVQLLKCEVIQPLAIEVISHALAQGDEEIIRYLSTVECFDFKQHAEKAFVGDLEVRSGVSSWRDRYPVNTFRLLTMMSDAGPLELDYPLAMTNAIKRGELDIVQFLVSRPEVDLPASSWDYLMDAVYDYVTQEDILEYLLSLPEIYVDQDIVDDLLDHSDGLAEKILLKHPKTREYALVHHSRPREY